MDGRELIPLTRAGAVLPPCPPRGPWTPLAVYLPVMGLRAKKRPRGLHCPAGPLVLWPDDMRRNFAESVKYQN